MRMYLCNEKYISRTQNVKRKRKKTEFIKFKNGKGENLKRKISASRCPQTVYNSGLIWRWAMIQTNPSSLSSAGSASSELRILMCKMYEQY